MGNRKEKADGAACKVARCKSDTPSKENSFQKTEGDGPSPKTGLMKPHNKGVCFMNEQNTPVYTFTYASTKSDVQQGAETLLGWRGWRIWDKSNILYCTAVGLYALAMIWYFASSQYYTWQRAIFYVLIILTVAALALGICSMFFKRDRQAYTAAQSAGIGQPRTYAFYEDRVEITAPEADAVVRPYTDYTELDLYPARFYLLAAGYQGEHLPWSAVPEEIRKDFVRFLVERAKTNEVPVNNRAKKQ